MYRPPTGDQCDETTGGVTAGTRCHGNDAALAGTAPETCRYRCSEEYFQDAGSCPGSVVADVLTLTKAIIRRVMAQKADMCRNVYI